MRGPHQLLVLDPGHLDEEVDPVQEWPTDPLAVPGHRAWSTRALPHRVAGEATRARVHRRDQHEVGRVGYGPLGPTDGHHLVLQRLAQGLQRRVAELGQLVEKQHSPMAQGYLPGPRHPSPAHEARVGCRVVGRSEGTLGNERGRRGQKAADAVYLRDLEGLLVSQRRQDGGETASQKGLAAAGRATHEQVVTSCRGHLQRPLGVLLAAHVD